MARRRETLLLSLLLIGSGCTGTIAGEGAGASGAEDATAPRDATPMGGEDAMGPRFDGAPPPDAGPGADGGLHIAPGTRSALMPADWSPGLRDAEGRFLQDFSYAGYRHGEEPPIDGVGAVFPVEADPSGAADASAAVTAAIGRAEAAGGGVVLFPVGTYRIASRLRVSQSGIVLRGAGPEQTRLLFEDASPGPQCSLTFRPTSYREADERALAVDGAPFDTHVALTSTAGLAVGDDVVIGWRITDAFRAEHNASDWWYHVATDTWRAFFRRTITAIDPDTGRVSFEVPLRYVAKTRDAASLRRVTGYMTESGLEGVAISNAVDYDVAWQTNQPYSAVCFTEVKNGWVRDVQSFESARYAPYHLRSHGITITNSVSMLVADTHLARPAHRGDGGNGYLFHLSRSNEVLVRDCTARHGRHNFSINWDFGASGNVFLRVTTSDGRGFASKEASLSTSGWLGAADFHHALAIANLIDQSTIEDAWEAVNRRDYSTGAGPTGTMNVFWNNRGPGTAHIRSFQTGVGYVIGTAGLRVETAPSGPAAEGTEPEDYTELIGGADGLSPPSLYEEQLARRRLGR